MTTTAPPIPAAPHPLKARTVMFCLLAGCLAGTGFGLSMPVLAFSLETMGASGTVIGLNATVGALSTLVTAPLIPRLMQRMPPRRILMAALLFTAACFPLFQALPNIPLWFVLRFVMGMGLTVLFVASETWLNQIATPRDRGRLIAFYATALGIGFALGGALPSLVGVEGWRPFLTGSAIFAVASLPLMMRALDPEKPDAHAASWGAIMDLIRQAPVVTMAALCFGAVEMSLFTFLPLYGDGVGLGPQGGALLLSAAAIGAVGMPPILGWFADRGFGRALLFAAALGTAIGFAGCLVFAHIPWLLYASAFFGGGMALSMYTLGLTDLGSRFTGSAVVTANAVFVTLYGLGSLVGPGVSGVMRDQIGLVGVPLALCGFGGLYALVILARGLRRNPVQTS